MNVDKNHLVFEYELHKFVVEASSIGLRPGTWPDHLSTDLGNNQPFVRGKPTIEDGDLLYVTYAQANGSIVLRVYND
jgi:hypothetical protein